MDALKIIPQVFFDLIARVTPGILAIIMYLILNMNSINDILTLICKLKSFYIFLFFLVVAYILGQLISPFAKLLQRVGEIFFKIQKSKENTYNKLRSNNPYVGDLCSKIRAEFMMHYSFSVVFIISAISYAFDPNYYCYYEIILLFLSIITFFRGNSNKDTFEETVAKFGEIEIENQN